MPGFTLRHSERSSALEEEKPAGQVPSSAMSAVSKRSEKLTPSASALATAALSAWPRSTQLEIGGAGPVGRGLVPLGGVERAGVKLAGLVGDEHEEADIGAVVGDVDRLLVGHHLGEFDRDAAHRVVLGDRVRSRLP